MRGFLELIMTNEIDTKVETKVIQQSDAAKAAEKLMRGINTINQQVKSVFFESDPQKENVVKALPDFACIEFTLRMQDIRKWQRAARNLLAPSFANKKYPTIREIHEAMEENAEALKKVKRPRLK